MRRNEEQIAIYSRKSKFTGKGESIGSIVDLIQMGYQFAIKQQRGEICFLVLPEVSMAHSAVLAIPGRFFFREFQIGIVHSVSTKGLGAAHFFK